MTTFSILALSLGVMIFCAGALSLMWRQRVTAFVRARFEKVYREDGVSDHEIEARLPSVRVIVSLAVGAIAISGVFMVGGLVL